MLPITKDFNEKAVEAALGSIVTRNSFAVEIQIGSGPDRSIDDAIISSTFGKIIEAMKGAGFEPRIIGDAVKDAGRGSWSRFMVPNWASIYVECSQNDVWDDRTNEIKNIVKEAVQSQEGLGYSLFTKRKEPSFRDQVAYGFAKLGL